MEKWKKGRLDKDERGPNYSNEDFKAHLKTRCELLLKMSAFCPFYCS